MKDNRDCKIVRDLLPNYIENLTDKETNQYIEEHLENCQECKNICENMKKELSTPKEELTQRKVDGFKKYNKKLKLIRNLLLLIITGTILIFFISTTKKIIIFKDLYDKSEINIDQENYYIQATNYVGSGIFRTEVYKKGEKFVENMDAIRFSTDENGIYNRKIFCQKETRYHDEEKTNYYVELNFDNQDASKCVQLHCENVFNTPSLNFSNRFSYEPSYSFYLDTTNYMDLLKASMWSDITLEDCNMKKCYKIELRNKPRFMYQIKYGESNDVYANADFIIWIDRETGLTARYMYGNAGAGISSVVDYTYSIGTVKDEDIVEPNMEEYKVVEELIQ